MPGTRNRTAAPANSVENPGASPSNRRKQPHTDSGENEMPDTASPSMPQRGRRGQIAATTEDSAVSSSAGAGSRLAVSPVASPRKRGRPRKDESARETTKAVDSSVESSASKSDAREKSDSSLETEKNAEKITSEDGGKGSSPSKGKVEGPNSGEVFSPRRSGRGVVFNRRFQDMELDFGKKRSKEERLGEPKEKRARTQGKKEAASKGQKTPVKGSGKAKDETPVTTTTGASRSQPDSAPPPLSTALSVQQRMTSHSTSTLTSPRISIQSSGKAPPAGRVGSSPDKRVQASVVPQSGQSPSSITRSVVMISASSPSVTHTVTSAARTVAINSSTALLAHTAPQQDDSAMNTSVQGKKSDQSSSTPWKESITVSAEGILTAGGVDTLVEKDGNNTSVKNTMDSPTVVEVALVAAQPGARGPRVVNISPVTPTSPSESGSKVSAETPGRVVGKPSTEAVSVSKSVFIVRNPPAPSSSSARTESSTSAPEEGAGDVTSMVELSPNKKVPVVLAKRKEHALAVSKVVKVVSSQQVLQPLTAPKVQISKVQERSPNPLESVSSDVQSEKPAPQKTVPIQVSVASLPSSTPQILVSKKPLAGENIQVVALDTNLGDDQGIVSVTTSRPFPPVAEVQGKTSQSDGAIVTAVSASPITSVQAPDATTTAIETMAASEPKAAGNVVHSGDLDAAQSQPLVTSVSKSVSCGSFTEDDDDEEDDDDDDDDDDSEEGILLEDKYTTSGTQTPYAKSNARRVITVHVHPPSKAGEQNREVVTVTKVERDDDSSDSHDRKEYLHRNFSSDTKGKYIVVDLPEGTTVKQPFVRSSERFDSDPGFYTMDEQGMFVCHICDYRTLRRPNFYKHKKKHLGVRQYACDQCQYRAATSSNLKRHMEIHRDIRNHKCTMCDLYFRQKIHLERHIKYRHEEKKVKCPFCDYICANENPDLKVHIKRRHIAPSSSEAAMKCPECGIVATSKRDLRQHLKFHSKGPELKLFCNLCSFVTDCESRLRRHQYIHTKEKPFQCGLCEYRGSQKEHVLRHMRTQHNIEIARNRRSKKMESEKSADGEGPRGSERADYTSDEKIFACNHCTMKFAKLINLYKHLHTQHRDIMPSEQTDFSCVVCDFHTTNKKNLLVHMRRHNVTDQSPPSHVYSCVLCRYMNPKRRNLFQHMRKKHHIEIVTRDDGSTTCYVATDPVSGVATSGAGGVSMSPQDAPQGSDPMITVLPLSDLISTVAQPTDLQAAGEGITIGTGTVQTPLKMEDIAMVVSNPQTATVASIEGESSLVDSGAVETITIGALSQDDAAEAIQGLQALAQRGVLENGAIVEEQVQVMGSDDQTTLVIDPSSFGMVEQLVQPKTEPLEVVEIDGSQLLDQVTAVAIPSSQQEAGMLGDSGSAVSAVATAPEGFQLSAEQLMNLSTGDLLEINGEMFKVEVSSESHPDGSQGQQIISFEPVSITPETVATDTTLDEAVVASETAGLT